MKKSNKPEYSSDENSNPSPVRKAIAPNKMMMNWLKQSAKKCDKEKEINEENKNQLNPKENKSQYFGNMNLNKKEETRDKLTMQNASKSSKNEELRSDKKSPKNELKKKIEKKKSNLDTDEDDDEDNFLVNKKTLKSSELNKTKTTPIKQKKEAPSKEISHKSAQNLEPESMTSNPDRKTGNKYYAAYMRREGPKNPGSKSIPVGKKECFAGLKFLITGVLESLERDECKSIIEKYGGNVVSGVTKKLDYLIVGEDAGQSKLEKAAELKIKKLTEDEFLKLICDKSGIKEPKYEQDIQINDYVQEEETTAKRTKSEKQEPQIAKISQIKAEKLEFKTVEVKQSPKKTTIKKDSEIVSQSGSNCSGFNESSSQLWVDKYKPKTMNKIIGQLGEKSNANKLLNWLKNWNKWHLISAGGGTKKSWNDQDTGSSFKCALLSGPPGIGKTTTAQLTCQEADFSYIELNASDSRSKKLLDSILGESTESASIDSYLKGSHKLGELNKDKHCIIMDEVDGMAGNEDRGGIQQLISIIKSAKIPIICICNDRQHPKIRTLANYCFDLRFYKPRLEQVRSALMSVCFKEGIKIGTDLLDQIITGCNYDIRQCLHNLSMWSSNNKNFISSQQKTVVDIEKAMKDVRMNPFEACKQVFHGVGEGKPPRTINEKLEFFFTDYSLMPLLIQENYLSIHPSKLEGNKQKRERMHLDALKEAVESMIESDRVGKMIRIYNNWSLLPTQAVFATLIPGEKLTGSMGLPAFPSWFGKNSKQGRVDRVLQELQKHMRIHISANKLGVGMDYLSVLKNMLTKPLITKGTEGISRVIDIMNEYSLTREDFDTIVELATWPNQKDVMSMIDSKVKASFTRSYNKESHKNPFTIVNFKKLKGPKSSDDQEISEEDISENEDNDDIMKDAMIKANIKKSSKKSSVSTVAPKSIAVKRAAAKASDDIDNEKSTAKKKKKA